MPASVAIAATAAATEMQTEANTATALATQIAAATQVGRITRVHTWAYVQIEYLSSTHFTNSIISKFI